MDVRDLCGNLNPWEGVRDLCGGLSECPNDHPQPHNHAKGQSRSKAGQSGEGSAAGPTGETARRLNHPLENPGTVVAGGTGTPAIGPHAVRICALLTHGGF